MEHLDKLNALTPSVFYGLMLIWILREILGYLKTVQERKEEKNELSVVLEAFNRVADNIEKNTEIIHQFTYELKVLQNKVDALEDDIADLRRS